MCINRKPVSGRIIECCIVTDLKKQLRKILNRYSKDLELYLQSAQEPVTTNKLFTQEEIRNFIDKHQMLPLEKLVILSEKLERCVTLNFTGTRTASLPLKSVQNADDYFAQLHFNVYPVISLMGDRSAAFEQLDKLGKLGKLDTRITSATNVTPLRVSKIACKTSGVASEKLKQVMAKPKVGERAMDLGSLDALVTAARYGGFTVRISIQRPKAA